MAIHEQLPGIWLQVLRRSGACKIYVSLLDIGADQFYAEPVTNICSLLPLRQQAFHRRFHYSDKCSVRGHSSNDAIENLTDSITHRDGSDSL